MKTLSEISKKIQVETSSNAMTQQTAGTSNINAQQMSGTSLNTINPGCTSKIDLENLRRNLESLRPRNPQANESQRTLTVDVNAQSQSPSGNFNPSSQLSPQSTLSPIANIHSPLVRESMNFGNQIQQRVEQGIEHRPIESTHPQLALMFANANVSSLRSENESLRLQLEQERRLRTTTESSLRQSETQRATLMTQNSQKDLQLAVLREDNRRLNGDLVVLRDAFNTKSKEFQDMAATHYNDTTYLTNRVRALEACFNR